MTDQPSLPEDNNLTYLDEIPGDPLYNGLKVIHFQRDPEQKARATANKYQFQHDSAGYTAIRATLCRKGHAAKPRLVAIVHPNLKIFCEMVKYNPANPPADNYEAKGMIDAHKRTQSDFQGQKAQNAKDFQNYLVQGLQGHRVLYLPVVSGWQSPSSFAKTVFVAYDESDPDALYGHLYLPKEPIMQADGQTQTAALFGLRDSREAIEYGAFEKLRVTLEVELNVAPREAGQSFADRNGRGTKKNRNLVIGMDKSSALGGLRHEAIVGTIFEDRVADGRDEGTPETKTKYIVDLSTLEQMLLNVCAAGKKKAEHFGHHYIPHFKDHCRSFIQLLDRCFGKHWAAETPPHAEPFRRYFVHGWPFALKAIALAYHEVNIAELGPLAAAMNTERSADAKLTVEERYRQQMDVEKAQWKTSGPITSADLEERLKTINWVRWKRHWARITGIKTGKDGKPKIQRIWWNGTEVEVVKTLAENTATVIAKVRAAVLSPNWRDLASDVDAEV